MNAFSIILKCNETTILNTMSYHEYTNSTQEDDAFYYVLDKEPDYIPNPKTSRLYKYLQYRLFNSPDYIERFTPILQYAYNTVNSYKTYYNFLDQLAQYLLNTYKSITNNIDILDLRRLDKILLDTDSILSALETGEVL